MHVLIVGGGVVGLACAHALLGRGADVTVCEAGTLGGGSTGRAAGGIRTQFSTRVNVELSLSSIPVWESFAEDFGVDMPTDGDLEDQIWAQLGTCYDPEIPVDIVQLGLVYSMELEPLEGSPGLHHVDIKMTLTAPGCGMGDVIKGEVEEKVQMLPGVASVMVDLVFEPQWDQTMMSDEARLKTGMM